MKWTIGKRIAAGFATAAVAMTVLGTIAYRNTVGLTETSEWVAHTHEVLGGLAQLTSELKDAETGQRGFLITNEERYLEPYHSGTQGAQDVLDYVQELTSDNPAQQDRIETLRGAVDEKFAELAQTIALRRDEGFDAALEVVLTDAGKAVMDEIRGVMSEMEAEERSLLEQRSLDAATSASATQNILLYGTILTIVVLVAVGVFTSRSITKPLARAVEMIQEMGMGHLSGRLEIDSQDEIGVMARTMDKFAEDLQVLVVGLLNQVAAGDTSTDVECKDEDDEIAPALQKIVGSVRGLVAEAKDIAEAAVQGRLDHRGDSSSFEGDFRAVIQGLNDTMDAIATPIGDSSAVLERIASRDLTARMDGTYRGDFATIKDSINLVGDALHDALVQVADATDQVASASSQIAASSQAVAQGTSEQASSLEETSSSLEEMSGMTKQNADNTQQAKVLAQSTKDSADKGSESMVQMIDSMSQIRTSAEGTAAIIKDINEIAFQTNLLALNAAVEAARAGDAGRGFAVVAEEVRNLALRSKEAATKTEELIRESVNLAEQGGQISEDVNTNLTEIVGSVTKVADIVTEIAAASSEQARGIEQVNLAMSQMDSVVQQSAANAEESSSAAEELSSQSQELAATVGRFQLSRSAHSGGRVVGTIPTVPTVTQAPVKNVTPKQAETIIPFEDDDEALASF